MRDHRNQAIALAVLAIAALFALAIISALRGSDDGYVLAAAMFSIMAIKCTHEALSQQEDDDA